jgi:hypothetical protein
MLELKSKNLFIKSGFSSEYSISRVLEFYDLIGKNILLLKNESSNLSSWVRFSKKDFTLSNLENVLSENLFRVNLLVVDTDKSIEETYDKIRKITEIPVIFITSIRNDDLDIKNSKGSIKVKNFDTVYVLSKNRSVSSFDSDSLSDFIVESIKDEWKSNLKDLKKQYIRHQNLKDLLGDSD